MTKIRDVTEQELHALRLFARTYGRTWKAKLTDVYWYNARVFTYGTESYNCLHALRNDPRWGHEGLAKFRFPKDDSEAAARKQANEDQLNNFNWVGSRHHY